MIYDLHPSGLVEKGEPRICASFYVLFESVIFTPACNHKLRAFELLMHIIICRQQQQQHQQDNDVDVRYKYTMVTLSEVSGIIMITTQSTITAVNAGAIFCGSLKQ